MIQELGLQHHVQWIDRYMPEEELVSLISACDLYVTPYPGMGQITSGTLAYAAGLGRPILSTPYVYALDLVQGREEMLLPYGNAEIWSAKLIELFTYPGMLADWERAIWEIGQSMHWPHVGAQHLRLFQRMISQQRTKLRMSYNERTFRQRALPSFAHLRRLTDDTGLLEHALGRIPDVGKAIRPTTTQERYGRRRSG